MKLFTIFAALSLMVLAASCAKIPPPTQEEIYARDQWAAVVTEEDRTTVFKEVNIHTSWSEKAKVLYELNRFQHIWHAEDRKARTTQPSKSKASSRPTTTSRPTTRSTTRSTTRPTTRKHTGHYKGGTDDDMQE